MIVSFGLGGKLRSLISAFGFGRAGSGSQFTSPAILLRHYGRQAVALDRAARVPVRLDHLARPDTMLTPVARPTVTIERADRPTILLDHWPWRHATLDHFARPALVVPLPAKWTMDPSP